MVFSRKPNIPASASRLLSTFVSSELGNRVTISYLSVKQSKLSPRGAVDYPVALLHAAEGQGQQCIGSSILLTVAQKGMK